MRLLRVLSLVGDKKGELKGSFKSAMAAELDLMYGCDEDDMDGWNRLCHDLGIVPVPTSAKACGKVHAFFSGPSIISLSADLLTIMRQPMIRKPKRGSSISSTACTRKGEACPSRSFPTLLGLYTRTMSPMKKFPQDKAEGTPTAGMLQCFGEVRKVWVGGNVVCANCT